MKFKLTSKAFKDIRNFIILLVVIGFIYLFFLLFPISFNDINQTENFVSDFGIYGPIIVILIIILEVVIAPIPGFIIIIASGYLFGPVFGTLYAYIGNIFGTLIAFLLARRFGRPFVKRIINEKKLKLYDCFFKERGKTFLWISFIFPVFPTDIISFIAGFSNIKLKNFMFIVMIAYVPNLLILSYFGSAIALHTVGFELIVAISFVLFIVVFGVLLFHHLKKNSKIKCNLNTK
ncbi:MAG: TVP38/TMEM64 family protein [Nanoarchaeota archaeon]